MSIENNKKILFTIEGEPASKSNSRKIVSFGKRMGVIKSEKARNYEKLFANQCPTLENLIETDVKVELIIHYASRRPDLDESVILDCMQGKIYVNDRQVKQKHIYWGLDRERPRTHVRVSPMEICDLPSDFG
jgi:Holliday junction resolvase RusA-like endonuclease